MNGINQLIKGIVIGIVLLLAVIGLLNISGINEQKIVQKAQPEKNIPAPSISINNATESSSAPQSSLATKSSTLPDLNLETDGDLGTPPNERPSGITDASVEDSNEGYKPEIIEEPITYGTLNLSAKEIGSNTPQNVDFFVFDKNNKQVTASKDTANASFQLASGQYKVVTRLGEQKKTTTVLIQKDRTSSEIFSMQPPVNTGIVQVSAFSNNKKPIKTRFIIQDMDGNIVGQRQQVSSTLFKLEAGTYIISANNDDLSEARTVKVEAGSSRQETFTLKKSTTPGKVLLSAREEGTNKAIDVDLIILSEDGKPVKRFKSVSNADVSLKAGNYLVRATGPNGQSSRKISLAAGQTLSEAFSFKRPQKQPSDIIERPSADIETAASTSTPPASTTTSSNDIPSTAPQSTPVDETAPEIIAQGILKLRAVSATDRTPIKSNFYVQTPNGKHIDKRTYADSASFKLDKGTYKITIKSKDMKTVTKIITLDADSKLNRIFALQSSVSSAKTAPSRPATSEPIYRETPQTATRSHNAPVYSEPRPTAPPATGSLVIEMQPAKNLKTSPNALLTNFLIKTRSGKKIAHIRKVQLATVKLDVGKYVVTANLRGQKKSKRFRIKNGQATKVSFRTSDFQSSNPRTQAAVQKGILRSRIIDNQGRPLKGNLTVSNQKGKVVRRANNVSMAEFELPAKPFTVNISYQGLSGSERVNIVSGETTVQTFTIASTPEQQPPQQANRSRNKGNSSKEIRDALKEKLKEELQRFVR